MKIKPYYTVFDDDGEYVVYECPVSGSYMTTYTLTPDPGKALVHGGQKFFGDVDTDSPEGWTEVDA